MVLQPTSVESRCTVKRNTNLSLRLHAIRRFCGALYLATLLQIGCGSAHLNPVSSAGAGPVSVTLTPAQATVSPSGSLQLAVTGGAQSSFVWSVNNIPGGNTALGLISTTGEFSAPSVPPSGKTVTVQVTSTSDPTSSASALLTISDVVSVVPSSASLAVTDSLQFSATVNQSPSGAVTWQVNGIPGGNSVIGTISAAGLYQAPTVLPASELTITAVENANPKADGSAQLSLFDPAIIAVHDAWLAGVAQAAADYGCTNIDIQQQESEWLGNAIARFTSSASEGSCLVLWPISTDVSQLRYSFSWGGTENGKDILYLSDVGQPRIWNAQPVSNLSVAPSVSLPVNRGGADDTLN